MIIMGRWIEIEDGSYPDGFPKSRYKHETCKEDKAVERVYPYCPYCGEKMTHVKVLRYGFEEYSIKQLTEKGYICE